MSGMTRKDAEDLRFITRDQAIDVVIRLMEERDACVEALEAGAFVEHALPFGNVCECSQCKFVRLKRAAIAKAKGAV